MADPAAPKPAIDGTHTAPSASSLPPEPRARHRTTPSRTRSPPAAMPPTRPPPRAGATPDARIPGFPTGSDRTCRTAAR